MDTDNRVVLNCGGIRHEVYKVKMISLSKLIFLVLIEKTELSCQRKYFLPLLNLRISDKADTTLFGTKYHCIYDFTIILFLDNSKEDPRHQTVATD